MSVPERFRLVRKFQWLAIPHGMTEPSAGGKKVLRATIRIIPQLFSDDFETTTERRLKDLTGSKNNAGIAAVMSWPDFVSKITAIKIGFGGADPQQPPIFCDGDFSDRVDALADLGANTEVSLKLWSKMFGPNLRVDPIPRFNTPEFNKMAGEKEWQRLPALKHASGANLLRQAIGGLHSTGLASAVAGSAGAISAKKRAGVVQVNSVPSAQASTRELGGLFTSLSAAPSEHASYKSAESLGSNMPSAMQAFSSAPIHDLERVRALNMPLNETGLRKLLDKIETWNTSSGSPFLNNTDYQLTDFVLERALSTAPDLPTAGKLQKTRESRAANGVDIENPPEFHAEMGKIATHSWMMDVLGLSINVLIHDPPPLTGDIGLFVESVEHENESFLPERKAYVMTRADQKVEAERWHPLEETPAALQLAGCIRLTDRTATADTAPFVFEQLDIDSALEKVLTTIHTEASQIAAGVDGAQCQSTLSTLRTTGMSLLMRNTQFNYFDQSTRRQRRRDAAMAGDPIIYFAEDLLLGFRPDICMLERDAGVGSCRRTWKSLTHRSLDGLRVNGHDLADVFSRPPRDEGFVSPNARLHDGSDDESKQSRMQEVEELFCWRGWSLAAPRVEAVGSQSPRGRTVPAISYRCGGRLPRQRFGWGYRIGLRAVYLDGKSVSLEEAARAYDSHPQLTLGTGQVGSLIGAGEFAQDQFFSPFLRYESIQPPIAKFVSSGDYAADERPDRILVKSDGYGRIMRGSNERLLAPPRIDIDSAIRAGAFDESNGRPVPPASVDVPDPWARRLILGFYRRADGQLLRLEYFDHDADVRWPKLRTLKVRVEAIVDDVLPVHGFEVRWNGDMLIVRLGPGISLDLRYWYEIDKQQLAASGVIEAMAQWLVSADPTVADTRTALGLSACADACDMRDELIELLSQWHLKFPYDLRPYLAAGHPAREVNLTSFSMLNPANTLELVHALAVPARAPQFSQATVLAGARVARLPMTESEVARKFSLMRERRGATVGEFEGDIEIHRASTERIDCTAEWNDITDDRGTQPIVTHRREHMFSVDRLNAVLESTKLLVKTGANPAVGSILEPAARLDLPPDNDLLMLNADRPRIGRLRNQDLGATKPHFDFADTKARQLTFEARATSRFINDFPDAKGHHRESIRGESRWLKATMPPAKPEVAFIVPLFQTETSEDDNSRRNVRRGGWFRIWLERPWFSSGEGELLALVCWPGDLFRARGGSRDFLTERLARAWGSLANQGAEPRGVWPAEQLDRLYTGWGLDPLWEQPGAHLNYIPPGAFANRITPDVPPVIPSQFEDLPPEIRETLGVGVALYRPEFDRSEGRWFVDVQITPDAKAYFPFVRLGLARYQPNAIDRCQLSEIVASEFVQLTPERSATVKLSPDRGRSRRTVSVNIVGQGTLGLWNPDGEEARKVTQIAVRVDESAGRPRRDAPRTWVPRKGVDGREEVLLEFDPVNRGWRIDADYDLDPGEEYSVYLEEREGILMDGAPDARGDTTTRAEVRVTYVDRIPLRI